MNCLNVATTAISNLSPADVLKAVIAMSGSAIGLLAGLGQISLSSKSRQTIEWINNTIDKDTGNEPRQKILKELRLSQEGRLIAAHYVPWWKFMLLPTWAIGYAVPTIHMNRIVHTAAPRGEVRPTPGQIFIQYLVNAPSHLIFPGCHTNPLYSIATMSCLSVSRRLSITLK